MAYTQEQLDAAIAAYRREAVKLVRDLKNRGFATACTAPCFGPGKCSGLQIHRDAYADAWRIAALEIEALK